jgi:long-subunit acyl-CoA synthetase (AMP-forming)
VPPHAPLTARQVHFQLAETETRWLFVSNQEQLEKIRQVQGELPKLEGIVVFDSGVATPEARSWASLFSTAGQCWSGGAPS